MTSYEVRTECQILDKFLLPDPEGPKDADQKREGDQPDRTSGKKKKKGGKGRSRAGVIKVDRGDRLCPVFMDVSPERSEAPTCGYMGKTGCRFQHDVKAFFEGKPDDVGDKCYAFQALGRCPRGLTCRFARSHVQGPIEGPVPYRNVVNRDVYDPEKIKVRELNHLGKDLQFRLRRKDYDFSRADKLVEDQFRLRDAAKKEETASGPTAIKEEEEASGTDPEPKRAKVEVAAVEEGKVEKLYPAEKKKIVWKDKTYLAPLTTVGNLPFRRICKKFGVDITCGEMALGLPLLQGHAPEWALVQRHESEDLFGIQLCGASPNQMGRVAQIIEDGHIRCDFVDVNLGCPIDLIYNQGMGSGMMNRKRKLEVLVRSMSEILTVPLTLKMRTGVASGKNIAHTIIPDAMQEWGASLVTVHGRSREQRYSRLADWSYINQCAESVPEEIPVFGNGDVINYEDYALFRKIAPRVSGAMIARGALIKPWVFTEIKERRHWDISSSERLDMIKDYANYGMEHWGSDDKGIETTRRFMLEWLSFLHRYVPYGILAQPPQRMNERVPKYFQGRDELETLLLSPKADDWIKISEMFLGKVPDGFTFEPKHKAAGYK